MEPRVIVIIAILSVVIIVCGTYLLSKNKKDKSVMVDDSLFGLFDRNNIDAIEFVRNKVVVSFKDLTQFDVHKLKELGGKGISVIGDKIKFYVSDKSQDNEKLYKDLMEYIER